MPVVVCLIVPIVLFKMHIRQNPIFDYKPIFINQIFGNRALYFYSYRDKENPIALPNFRDFSLPVGGKSRG
jgi:hypothetical protein